MKRTILTLAIMATTSVFFASCRETVTEEKEVIREVEPENKTERVEIEVEEEDKGILERTGEEIDNEVNKEIDEEIDQIGDDN